ncbi:DMT family transporter [bacterium]|nr:DMT family transporter [bacterium]
MQTERNAPGLGILFMVSGMFLISLNDMLIKGLAGDYPLHQIIMWRAGLGLLLTLVFLRMEGGWRLLRTDQPGLHILRALLVVFANSCFYAAIVIMPLATATALYFVAPLFVTLLSMPVLGEEVGPRRILAVLAGFGGVLLMMADQMRGDVGWAVLLPVLSAAGYAGMSVLTRKLGHASAASALALYLQVSFLVVAGMFYLVAGDGRFVDETTPDSIYFLLRAWTWPDTADIPLLVGLGGLSALIGYSMAQAYRQAKASTVAPFEYVMLIFALFWGWTVFDEWPAPSVFAGAAIIIGSGVYIFLREQRLKSR